MKKLTAGSPAERARAKRKRIGVFGGTFDPVHLGHLIAARDAAEYLRLDRVLFVPAGQPPHKRGRPLSPVADRLGMVRLAIRGDTRFACSSIELVSGDPSYTADTLRRLNQANRKSRLFLLIGLDQAAALSTWKNPEKLFALATVCALSRPGFSFARIGKRWRSRIVPVPVSAIDISASAIRARIKRGRSIRYLVPPAVEAHIVKNKLYRP